MDYNMEDTQNSAPDALEASKLNSSAQRSDTQSVTKRFVSPASLKHLSNHFWPIMYRD